MIKPYIICPWITSIDTRGEKIVIVTLTKLTGLSTCKLRYYLHEACIHDGFAPASERCRQENLGTAFARISAAHSNIIRPPQLSFKQPSATHRQKPHYDLIHLFIHTVVRFHTFPNQGADFPRIAHRPAGPQGVVGQDEVDVQGSL